MTTYHIVWEIDIEADSPREAVEQARAYQMDPNTSAVVFDAFDEDGDQERVDLLETFDRETFADYVVSHGLGEPTENAFKVGEMLFLEGYGYATTAACVVSRGETHESED